jgi:hypothetical protein
MLFEERIETTAGKRGRFAARINSASGLPAILRPPKNPRSVAEWDGGAFEGERWISHQIRAIMQAIRTLSCLKKETLAVDDISCEIVMQIGVLSQSRSGWTKELNLVSWNGSPPKYDIRDWSPDHSKLGKGVTLSREELLALRDLLNSWEL